MDYREFLEWQIYFSEVEVMPDSTREAAQVCAVVANANRGKGRPARVKDFIPQVGRRQQQSPDEMRAAFERAAGG